MSKTEQAINNYVDSFKDKFCEKVSSLEFDDKLKINNLLDFVCDFERLSMIKDDLATLHNRNKPEMSNKVRCIAKRSTGEQCTRRRKEMCDFCGTHSKNNPHGMVQVEEYDSSSSYKMEVFAVDIHGIVYFIDKDSNVYNTEDILDGKHNPGIVAKYKKTNDVYTIPEFGLI